MIVACISNDYRSNTISLKMSERAGHSQFALLCGWTNSCRVILSRARDLVATEERRLQPYFRRQREREIWLPLKNAASAARPRRLPLKERGQRREAEEAHEVATEEGRQRRKAEEELAEAPAAYSRDAANSSSSITGAGRYVGAAAFCGESRVSRPGIDMKQSPYVSVSGSEALGLGLSGLAHKANTSIFPNTTPDPAKRGHEGAARSAAKHHHPIPDHRPLSNHSIYKRLEICMSQRPRPGTVMVTAQCPGFLQPNRRYNTHLAQHHAGRGDSGREAELRD